MESIWYNLYTTLLAAFLGSLLLYWYTTKNHDYWKKRGVPYVTPYPIIGSSTITSKTQEAVEEERYNKYGKIYGLFDGNVPKLSLADPELIKTILVKDFQYFTTRLVFNTGDEIFDKMLSLLEGEDWRRVRAIISPTFSTSKIKRIHGIFQECSKTLVRNLRTATSKNDPIDVTKFYGAFSLDVIASAAFSTKIDCLNEPDNIFVRKAKNAFKAIPILKAIIFLIMPRILRMLNIRLFDAENMNFFKKLVKDIIDERKKTGQTRDDFLQLLMDTTTEVLNEEKCEKSDDEDEPSGYSAFKCATNKNLTTDELVAQCVIFFLAGYHTTATALSITTYFLAMDQSIQDKLFEEIKETLQDTNGELTYEAVHKMQYLDNVISESMRIYCPATRVDRTAGVDYKLGDTGIIIPKGMVVTIPTFVMHRDPKLFPDPEKFDPDRFNPEERRAQIPYSYLPFGSGPRKCVGMRFALMELKVCLVYVVRAFHFTTCSKTMVPLEFVNAPNVLQPKAIFLKMEPRSDGL